MTKGQILDEVHRLLGVELVSGERRTVYQCQDNDCRRIQAHDYIPFGCGQGRWFNPCPCNLTQNSWISRAKKLAEREGSRQTLFLGEIKDDARGVGRRRRKKIRAGQEEVEVRVSGVQTCDECAGVARRRSAGRGRLLVCREASGRRRLRLRRRRLHQVKPCRRRL